MIKAVKQWFVDLGEISSFPPIGLMCLAGYIRANSSHNVKIVDSLVEKMSYEDIAALIINEAPDILGMTAFTFTFLMF